MKKLLNALVCLYSFLFVPHISPVAVLVCSFFKAVLRLLHFSDEFPYDLQAFFFLFEHAHMTGIFQHVCLAMV